ncbi:hypothetical protein WJX77_002603 [Trebouxia sp. C0004]
MPTERGWTQVGPGKTKVKPALANGNKRNGPATNVCAAPQASQTVRGAPADVYNNSHQQIAAAASNPDLTSSQTDAAAASNIGLTEDGVGPVTWKLPDTERADIKSGKSSFDVLGQIIKPSQGPFTSDYYPGSSEMSMIQVIYHFPLVVGICQTAVKQLQDLDSNTSALQAQVDAWVSVNERQQLQITVLKFRTSVKELICSCCCSLTASSSMCCSLKTMLAPTPDCMCSI